MTESEKYHELLKALAELLASKNSDIAYYQYQIRDLENRLSDAEKRIEEQKKGN